MTGYSTEYVLLLVEGLRKDLVETTRELRGEIHELRSEFQNLDWKLKVLEQDVAELSEHLNGLDWQCSAIEQRVEELDRRTDPHRD